MKWIKLNEEAVIPERKTENSAGYDFVAGETVQIPPLHAAIVPTHITFEGMEPDQFLMITLRSSVSVKRPLLMANGVGIVDSDYAGNDIGVILFNRSVSVPVTIDKGERIAQGILLKYGKTEEKKVTRKRSGGFGSTGN